MNTCPACKYKEGLDPEQRYEHIGDETFERIEQLFVVDNARYERQPRTVSLYICPKCGCVSRQW